MYPYGNKIIITISENFDLNKGLIVVTLITILEKKYGLFTLNVSFIIDSIKIYDDEDSPNIQKLATYLVA